MNILDYSIWTVRESFVAWAHNKDDIEQRKKYAIENRVKIPPEFNPQDVLYTRVRTFNQTNQRTKCVLFLKIEPTCSSYHSSE